MKTPLLAALFASVLVAGPALAQDASTTPAANGAGDMQQTGDGNQAAGVPDAAARVAAHTRFLRDIQPGSFRFSELKGHDVSDANGQQIGQIDDVILDQNGQVSGFLVGVGGFLGIGTKDVAVLTDSLSFGTGNGGGEGSAGGQASNGGSNDQAMATGSTQANGNGAAGSARSAVPQTITLNASKDELQKAPAWDDMMSAGSDSANGTGNGNGANPGASSAQ